MCLLLDLLPAELVLFPGALRKAGSPLAPSIWGCDYESVCTIKESDYFLDRIWLPLRRPSESLTLSKHAHKQDYLVSHGSP